MTEPDELADGVTAMIAEAAEARARSFRQRRAASSAEIRRIKIARLHGLKKRHAEKQARIDEERERS